MVWLFFFKQKTAYEMRISDWSSDVCSSDLIPQAGRVPVALRPIYERRIEQFLLDKRFIGCGGLIVDDDMRVAVAALACLLVLREDEALFPAMHSVLLYPDALLVQHDEPDEFGLVNDDRSEEHTSELQSLMRISYAVFCLKKKKTN